MAVQELLFPLKKCPRDSELVKESLMTQFDVKAFASDSGHCFAFCGINGVFDSKKSVAKQMRILKAIGEFSTTAILRTSRHHFNYSTFLLVILSYLSIWLRDRADICDEDKKGHKNSTHEKYLHSNHG